MLERYLTVRNAGQRVRLELARRDRANPDLLVEDLRRSVEILRAYDNRAEPFHDPRPHPHPRDGQTLWETEDVTSHLDSVGGLRGLGELDADYVGREPVLTRTRSIRPTHVMQRVPVIRVDALLRARDSGRPVVAEIKTPTDVDTYYALIQVLAGASMLLTETQFARLGVTYPDTTFDAGAAGPQVDVAILTVDPTRCGREWHPTKGEQRRRRYRPDLDDIAEPIAEGLREAGIISLIPRLANIRLGLEDGALSVERVW